MMKIKLFVVLFITFFVPTPEQAITKKVTAYDDFAVIKSITHIETAYLSSYMDELALYNNEQRDHLVFMCKKWYGDNLTKYQIHVNNVNEKYNTIIKRITNIKKDREFSRKFIKVYKVILSYEEGNIITDYYYILNYDTNEVVGYVFDDFSCGIFYKNEEIVYFY